MSSALEASEASDASVGLSASFMSLEGHVPLGLAHFCLQWIPIFLSVLITHLNISSKIVFKQFWRASSNIWTFLEEFINSDSKTNDSLPDSFTTNKQLC